MAEPPKEGQVLPPDDDRSKEERELRKLKAVIESLAGPVLEGIKEGARSEIEKLRMQFAAAARSEVLQTSISIAVAAVVAFFAWLFLTYGKAETAERLIYLLAGFGLGFFGRRNR